MPIEHYMKKYGVSHAKAAQIQRAIWANRNRQAKAGNPKYRKYLHSKGWHLESERHSLAARGISTSGFLNDHIRLMQNKPQYRIATSRLLNGDEENTMSLFYLALSNAIPHERSQVVKYINEIIGAMDEVIMYYNDRGDMFVQFDDWLDIAIIKPNYEWKKIPWNSPNGDEGVIIYPLKPPSIYNKVDYLVNIANRR